MSAYELNFYDGFKCVWKFPREDFLLIFAAIEPQVGFDADSGDPLYRWEHLSRDSLSKCDGNKSFCYNTTAICRQHQREEGRGSENLLIMTRGLDIKILLLVVVRMH